MATIKTRREEVVEQVDGEEGEEEVEEEAGVEVLQRGVEIRPRWQHLRRKRRRLVMAGRREKRMEEW
jgi:hypothetical protein